MSQPTFFARRALPILIVIFFLIPFALRGARCALQGMKNDVADWLPADFQETAELEWFAKHFVGEQFVLVTWEGCHGDATDERFHKFVAQLQPETPPSQAEAARQQAGAAPGDEGYRPTKYLERAGTNFIGDALGLYIKGHDYQNWGGQNEKWLKGRRRVRAGDNQEAWYYLTPEGQLYRWHGLDTPTSVLWHKFLRWLGKDRLTGTLLCSFGPQDGPWYYENPKRLRAQLFKTLVTGPDVLHSLTRPGGELDGDLAEAHRRLSGTLFGPDDQQTCMVLTLTEAAKHNLHLVVGRGVLGKPRGQLYEMADACQVAPEQLRLGGPPVDNVAIDEEGNITLFRLISLCAVLGFILSYACFRSITAMIMVCFVGGLSAIVSVASVWWFGGSVDAVMMSMPSLVYVLGLSGSAHIINYYHDAVETRGYPGAPEQAVAHGWKPALLCNVTTAIGLLSLYTSELAPIRNFGLFSALGVMATLLVMFTYLPSCLELYPQKPRKRPQAGDDRPWLDKYLAGFWNRLGSFIIRHHAAVATGCTLVIVAFSVGVLKMRTSVNMAKMFHEEAKIIQDHKWLEEHLGELMPMEVVLKVPQRLQLPPAEQRDQLPADSAAAKEAPFQLSFLERLELTARVQQALEAEFGRTGQGIVGRALTAATFVRPLPKPKGDTRSFIVRSGTSRRLEAHRDEFLHSDYLRIDEQDEAELWRISLRVSALRGVDYGEFVKQLKYVVEPILAAQHQREQILRQLAAQQPDQRTLGSRVLLLGLPVAALSAAAEGAKTETANAGPRAAAVTATGTPDMLGTAVGPREQTRLFARTLIDQLTVARLKVKGHAPDKDPLPDNWAEILAAQDCVVLVGDHDCYDVDFISRHAKLVIDARQHQVTGDAPTASPIKPGTADIAAVYTGVVPIVYKAQRSLLDSLISSSVWSFLTITPLMMLIARSFFGGAVAMLPNVLPVVMVFGGMGWLNIDVDVGSMMTASIALGVAVDDTIHYLNWFKAELNAVGDRKQAILGAYRHCATPTFQAAVISGLGLSIFALSTFTPTQRFGYLMLTILWMGVAAELIFFPALLAGPLGAFFKPHPKKAGRVTKAALADGEAAETPNVPRPPHVLRRCLRIDRSARRPGKP